MASDMFSRLKASKYLKTRRWTGLVDLKSVPSYHAYNVWYPVNGVNV